MHVNSMLYYVHVCILMKDLSEVFIICDEHAVLCYAYGFEFYEL